MKRTKMSKYQQSPDLIRLKREMMCDAKGMNKYVKDEYLIKLTFDEILPLCHPSNRGDYKNKLNIIKYKDHGNK